VFDLQISKYLTKQHSIWNHNTRQNVTVSNNFWSYTIFLWTKGYFGILDNFYMGQKVVLWFIKGQEFQFLSCLLPPICYVPETILQIKHCRTGVVLFCPSFFSGSAHPNTYFHMSKPKKKMNMISHKIRISMCWFFY